MRAGALQLVVVPFSRRIPPPSLLQLTLTSFIFRPCASRFLLLFLSLSLPSSSSPHSRNACCSRSSCKLLRMWLAVRVACHAVVLLAVITEAAAQFNQSGGAGKGVAAPTDGTPHLCYDSAVAERLRSGESLAFVSAGMMRSSSTLLFNTLKTILKLQTIRPL